jgi:endonuclease G
MFPFLRAVLVVPVLFALTVSARGAEGDEHFHLGNPSAATTHKDKPDNYLLRKRQFVLSYNNSKGTPNWVS